MYQSCSLIQDWRRKRRKKKKKNTMKGLISKDRPIRTGYSQAPARPTPMPRTTAASCFPSWWPSESSFQPSSASAGCENKYHPELGGGVRERNQTCWFWFLYFSQWLTKKQTNKNHTQKLKEKKRGRVGREQPSSTTGPSPASVLVLSLWLAPAVSFLSTVLRVKRILHVQGSSSAHLVERTLNPQQTRFLFLG